MIEDGYNIYVNKKLLVTIKDEATAKWALKYFQEDKTNTYVMTRQISSKSIKKEVEPIKLRDILGR